MVSTSFYTWKQSTRGFHLVSSHWKLQETSQVVSTCFHTWKQSNRGFHLVSSHCKLQETLQVFFTSFHSCKILVKFTDTYKLYLTADFSHTCTMFPNHQFHNNYYLIKGNEHHNWTENIMHLSMFGYLYVKMFDKRRMYIYYTVVRNCTYFAFKIIYFCYRV